MTNSIKKLLLVIAGLAIAMFILANLHHVLAFVLVVGTLMTAFVFLTSKSTRGAHTRKRIIRFLKVHFSK